MIAWLKCFFEKRQKQRIHDKFVWIAQQLEPHMMGNPDESLSPVMALGGDIISHWDQWEEFQKQHFIASAEYLFLEWGRNGLRAMLKLKGVYTGE